MVLDPAGNKYRAECIIIEKIELLNNFTFQNKPKNQQILWVTFVRQFVTKTFQKAQFCHPTPYH